LQRIQQPPMGGDQDDYVQWALQVPGVTRAWCYPQEMGIGTCTVRFMMDDLRADNGGFPLPSDIDTVQAYLDTKRPVTVEDLFVVAPIPFPIDVPIRNLVSDDQATRANITTSLEAAFLAKSKPGQTWYEVWSTDAILQASGVVSFNLLASDVPMPAPGYMPVLGDITYV
jgi:uncharacterized phage protein gp47/JayE